MIVSINHFHSYGACCYHKVCCNICNWIRECHLYHYSLVEAVLVIPDINFPGPVSICRALWGPVKVIPHNNKKIKWTVGARPLNSLDPLMCTVLVSFLTFPFSKLSMVSIFHWNTCWIFEYGLYAFQWVYRLSAMCITHGLLLLSTIADSVISMFLSTSKSLWYSW